MATMVDVLRWFDPLPGDPTDGFISADDAKQAFVNFLALMQDKFDDVEQRTQTLEQLWKVHDTELTFMGRVADEGHLPTRPRVGDTYVDSQGHAALWTWIGDKWFRIDVAPPASTGSGTTTPLPPPFAITTPSENTLPAIPASPTLLLALDTGQWFLSDGASWNRLGLDPTTVLGDLNAALHRTDALRQDVDALKAQTVALDDLTDVAAPSTTPAGKVLGTTATGAWGPVDPPLANRVAAVEAKNAQQDADLADVVHRTDIVGMDPVPYDATHAYAEGDIIIYNGSWWVAKQPTTAGQDPTSHPGKWLVLDLEATALKAAHAANGAVPDAADPGDDGKVLTAHGGMATWAKAPLPPLPIVVKATQPTAADYHETTIPDGAVWLKKV